MSSNRIANLAVVVEDDEALRDMIRELLEMVGFTTVGCEDGSEGIRAVRELHPSVVTLDLHMPGMDGVEVLDRLGSDDATSSVPVVIVSAYSSDRRLRSRKQIKAILQKPFDVDELCRTVRRVADFPEPPLPHPQPRVRTFLSRYAV